MVALVVALTCFPAAPASAGQLITVEAARAATTTATVRIWRRSGDCWAPAGGPWQGRLGRNGLSDRHREGDGTTPTGAYGIGGVVYGIEPDPGVRARYHRIVCGDWWDGDSGSPTYNRFRHVRCGTSPPFRGGSEPLWRYTRAYRHFAEIRYNADPAVPGRGSAIFLHADTGGPTAGCVSLPAAALGTVLRWLRPAQAPAIVIGTRLRRSSPRS
jgi:L,D-peptidoglycan transpeptidase YkuD (ErfK/YbiS/YcfS/YnhG family)